jgi:hypothetical protein
MKQDKLRRFLSAVGELDEGILARYEAVDASVTASWRERQARKRALRRGWTVAAVLLLVVLPVSLLAILSPGHAGPNCPLPHDTADTEEHTTTLFAPSLWPEGMVGGSPLFVAGDTTRLPSAESSAPPAFRFESTGVVVKVRFIEDYRDGETVCLLGESAEYRLLNLEVLEVIHGENIHHQILYLLPAHLYTDLSAYDELILSATQVGTDGLSLFSKTSERIGRDWLPVFGDPQDHPELGNIIAFTDGLFDERLWQTESWRYGYQFARSLLDENSDTLVVRRGGTVEETVARIREEIRAEQERRGELYAPPRAYLYRDLEALSDQAKDAVIELDRGVCSQHFEGGTLLLRRYVFGCWTEETVSIDLKTGAVTRSAVRYTAEDQTVPLDSYLRELAHRYTYEPPVPPHTDPEGKELYALWVEGWFIKREEGVYAIIKTGWIHTAESEEGYPVAYWDEAFLLSCPDDPEGRPVTREELMEAIGEDPHLYWGEYGVPEEIPY